MITTSTRRGLGERLLTWLVGLLGWATLELLGRTWRIEIEGRENETRVRESNHRVIFAFWHGQLLPLSFTHRRRMIHTLVSIHRDGGFIAAVLGRLGFGTVRGSTSRGAVKGLLAMVAKANEGFDLGVTPDGPRGPAGVIQRGILLIARKSQQPILPLGVGASMKKNLGSWDSFMIPLPFSRVVVVVGEPMYYEDRSTEGDLDEASEDLRRELDALTERANALANSG